MDISGDTCFASIMLKEKDSNSPAQKKGFFMFLNICFDCAKDIYGIDGTENDYLCQPIEGMCTECGNIKKLLWQKSSNSSNRNCNRKKIEAPKDTSFDSEKLLKLTRQKKKLVQIQEEEKQRFIASLVRIKRHIEMIEESSQKECDDQYE